MGTSLVTQSGGMVAGSTGAVMGETGPSTGTVLQMSRAVGYTLLVVTIRHFSQVNTRASESMSGGMRTGVLPDEVFWLCCACLPLAQTANPSLD